MKLFYTLSYLGLWAGVVGAQSVTYTVGPTMTKPRVGHETKTLPNNLVLVLGGQDGNVASPTYYKTCLLYNEITNKWQAAPDMKYYRDDVMAVSLNDGNVLAIGGDNQTNFELKSCEIYNWKDNTWTVTDSLKIDHHRGAAIKLLDGRVLVAGGTSAGTVSELFDPVTKTWAKAGDMTFVHGEGMSLTLLANGEVLAVGGTSNNRAAEVFSPRTNTWTKIASSTKNSRQYSASVLLPNGKVLLAGASYFSTVDQLSAELYDPTSNTFTATSNLLINSAADQLVMLDNGKALLYGVGDIFTSNTKVFQEFDPATGLWTSGNTNFVGNSDYTITRLDNDKFLIVGGAFGTNIASSSTLLVEQTALATCAKPAVNTMFIGANCYGANGAITLQPSQTNFKYDVYMNDFHIAGPIVGTGNNLPISIPGEYLLPGDNYVSVRRAAEGCQPVTLSSNITIPVVQANTTVPVIALSSGSNLLCDATSKATIKVTSPTGASYRWSNGATGSEIVLNSSAQVSVRIETNGCSSKPSNMIEVKKVGATDVSAGQSQAVCQTDASIQLAGSPSGGTWTGTGISSSGLFSPSTAGTGTVSVTYSVCGYTSTKQVTVGTSNNVSLAAADVSFSKLGDTLCAGGYALQSVSNMKDGFDYKLYADQTLVNTFSTDNMSSVFYYPKSPPSQVVLKLKAEKRYQSQGCPKDSVVYKRTFAVVAMPSRLSGVIIPDSGCFGGQIICKIPKPEKGVAYYATLQYDDPATDGARVRAIGTEDTLVIRTQPIPTYIKTPHVYVIATTGGVCAKTHNVTVADKYPKTVDIVTSVNLGTAYYTNEKIVATTISNANYYTWTINGKAYAQKQMPALSYPTLSTQSYSLLAISKLGCRDTVNQTVKIIKKAPLAAWDMCFFDSLSTKTPLGNEVLDSHLDGLGNLILVGARFVDYAGNYNGSQNGFIEKYNKAGKLLWRLAHDPFYASNTTFHSFFVTAVTSDENNNLYVTGNYSARKLQFANITVDHSAEADLYPRAFISKITPDGKIDWFLYTKQDYKATWNEVGGSDIAYRNGMLYVPARMYKWGGKKEWRNLAGETIGTLQEGIEFVINKVDKNGTSVAALGNIDGNVDNPSSLNTGLVSLYTAHSNGYIANQIAVLSPKISFNSEGKIVLLGRLQSAAYFGSILAKPRFDGYGYNNVTLYAPTGYTAIYNENTTSFESVTMGSSTSQWNRYGLEYFLYPSAWGNDDSKVDATNFISTNQNNIWEVVQPKLYPTLNDSITKLPYGGTLLRKVDKAGKEVWKKILFNTSVRSLDLTSDQSQIVISGTYQNSVTTQLGNTDIGMHYSQSPDLFAMGIHPQTGDILWSERIGSANEDVHVTAALSGCNDYVIVGKQYVPTIYDTNAVIRHEAQQVFYKKENPFGIRIPLTGSCSPTSCKVVTELATTSAMNDGPLLYPNPANEVVYLKKGGSRVILQDMKGRILGRYLYSDIQEVGIPTTELPNGMYMIALEKEGKTDYYKLVVSH